MKTTITYYFFDTKKPEDKQAYAALAETLKATPGRGPWLHVWPSNDSKGSRKGENVTEEIELEEKHLFNNQWNTTDGRRVFDWFEAAQHEHSRNIKWGHYLGITQEMIDARDNTYGCQYCGHQEIRPDYKFHTKCLSSEYLKPNELKLIRMMPVSNDKWCDGVPELSDEERAELMPKYEEYQREALKLRLDKKRRNLIAAQKAQIEKAKIEYEVAIWIMDNMSRDLLTEENVIYYDHTKKVGIGWRTPLSMGQCKEIDRIFKTKGFKWDYAFDTKGR